MLNPESVDYNSGKVKLTFTDEEGNEAIRVYLDEHNAWKLHQMIQDKCNMPARNRRTYQDEQFDRNF